LCSGASIYPATRSLPSLRAFAYHFVIVVETANSVRYDQVNAMLLNEFLKAHRRMEEQDATIARQQKQIDALAAGLNKVSIQVELTKSAPQTVLNNR